MTYEQCLNQPKSKLEWKLIEKLDKNPWIIRKFNGKIGSHALIWEDRDIDLDEFYW